jgi:hypothetical protein
LLALLLALENAVCVFIWPLAVQILTPITLAAQYPQSLSAASSDARETDTDDGMNRTKSTGAGLTHPAPAKKRFQSLLNL